VAIGSYLRFRPGRHIFFYLYLRDDCMDGGEMQEDWARYRHPRLRGTRMLPDQ